MAGKYTFSITSEERQRPFPSKIIIGQQETETITHVVLKLIGYLLFFRERLQVEINLHNPAIPFVPDLVQLDYELRPVLWVECGECGVQKLHKLSVKAPDAVIWIIKKSAAAAADLAKSMQKEELRKNRYHIIGLDAEVFQEICGLVTSRNEIYWFKGTFDPPQIQMEFNKLWFDFTFEIIHF